MGLSKLTHPSVSHLVVTQGARRRGKRISAPRWAGSKVSLDDARHGCAGEVSVPIRRIAHRFGSGSDALREAVATLPAESLEDLADLMLEVRNLEDLEAWIHDRMHRTPQ